MSPRNSRPQDFSCPLWSVPVLALLVAGCADVGPRYQEPVSGMPTGYRYDSRKNGRSAATRDGWWKIFGDPGLNRLIGQVRSGNHDLRGGLKRIEQARAIARSTGADALPQVAANPAYTRRRDSAEISPAGTDLYSSTFTAPVDIDWEIDLFGRIRKGYEAAVADAQASEEDLRALLLSTEADAASRYFTLRALDREIRIVETGVTTRKSSLKLAQDRLDLGAVSALDVAQAKALLATSEADLAGLRRQRAGQEAAIAVLAGQPASIFSLPVNPLSGSPPRVPGGLPAELLRARPDIRRAERNLAAENARVGVAVAAFYPSISLTGSLGTQSADISKLFDGGARFWSIGPQIYVPIFQGGRNKAELARTQARYEEVLEEYQQVVLEGLSEVETSLAAWKYLTVQTGAQAEAVKAANEARDISRIQYEGGTANYLSVLDAERTALDNERNEATLSGIEFSNAVTLIRALGGRW